MKIVYSTEEDKFEILVIEKSPTSVLIKQKKKKLKKAVFNREQSQIGKYQVFLKEYKFDSSRTTCAAYNQQIFNTLAWKS